MLRPKQRERGISPRPLAYKRLKRIQCRSLAKWRKMRKMVRTKRYCCVCPDSSTLRAMMTAMRRMRVAQCCYYVREFVAADPAEMIVRTKILYALYFSPCRPSILFTFILRIITLRICVHLTIKKHRATPTLPRVRLRMSDAAKSARNSPGYSHLHDLAAAVKCVVQRSRL